MPAPSPLTESGSLVTFTIKAEGKEIDSGYQVESIETHQCINKIPRATIVIIDGSASKQDFDISSKDTLVPGKKIEILAGYDNKNAKSIFKGIIIKQGIEINQHSASKLVLEISDEALKLTLERKNGVFNKVSDSDLISRLVAQAGLAKSIEKTTYKHPEIVQYYATDWDMIVMRAELNSMVVSVSAGKVTVAKPDPTKKAVLELKYGDSIYESKLEMDAPSQIAASAIKSKSWNPATQKVVEAGPKGSAAKSPGNMTSAKLADVFKVKSFVQQAGPVDKPSLESWSTAELLKSSLSKIQGSISFPGNAKAEVGKTVELAGLGDRFNGNAYISDVRHLIQSGKWTTAIQVGLSPDWFSEETPDISAPAASGLLPPIRGLQTGIVKKITKDPAKEFRVFVNLPILEDKKTKGVWARLGTMYATNKAGTFFYPEVNDEVIVGFMNDDPRFAVILGSVYSKKNPPPFTPDDKNKQKAIVTRSKMQIHFDDVDKIIQIKTGKHTIKMDDKTGAISIKDNNKNTLSLSKGGIALDSGSNIKITAKGNITLQANANLKAAAKANASLEGLQVANKAKTKFSANGKLQSELTASGMVTVRGGMVKIN